MSASVCLFIGGSWNGKRERIPDERMMLKIATAPPHRGPYGCPSLETLCQDELYERQFIADGEKRLHVFVSASLHENSLIETLIEGYRRP